MSQIKIREISVFHSYEDLLANAGKELDSVAEEIRSVRSNLRYSMLTGSYTRLCNSLDSAKQSVNNCAVKTRRLKTTAEEIRDLYSRSESQICDGIAGNSFETVDVWTTGKNAGSQGSETPYEDISDVLSLFSKIIKQLGKAGDGDQSLYTTGGLLTMVSGVLDLLGGDQTTLSDFLEDFADAAKGTTGFVSGLLKVFGNGAAGKNIGIISDVLGTLGKIYGSGEKDPAELLKDMGGLFQSSSKLGVSVYDMIHPEYFSAVEAFKGKSGLYMEKTANIAAIGTIATMVTTLAGNTITVLEDGKVTTDEVLHGLLDTAVAGGDSLISGLTFGIVDIDADFAVNSLESNSSKMTDWISGTGLPLEAQVALGVVTAPVVVIDSAVDVAKDTIDNVAEDVVNMGKWIASWFPGM